MKNNMDDQTRFATIRRTTRRRFWFAGITLVLYFSFVLNWTSVGQFLGQRIGGNAVTGSLLMFAGLIVIFILMEAIFLKITNSGNNPDQE